MKHLNLFEYSYVIYNRPKSKPKLTTAAILQKKQGLDVKLNKLGQELMNRYVSQNDAPIGGLEARLEKKFNKPQNLIAKVIRENPKVKQAMDVFRSILKRTMVGFNAIVQKLKKISPKANETPTNLLRLRNQLNKMRKQMEARMKEIRAKAKDVEKVVEAELPRADMDRCKYNLQGRLAVPVTETVGIHTYSMDVTKVPLFMDYVNGMLNKTPKEFADSFDNKDIVKKFNAAVDAKLNVYKEFAKKRAAQMHYLDESKKQLKSSPDYQKLTPEQQQTADRLFDEQVYKPGMAQLNAPEYNEGEIEREAKIPESMFKGNAEHVAKTFVKKNKEKIEVETQKEIVRKEIDKHLKQVMKLAREKYLAQLKKEHPELAKKGHGKFVRKFGIAYSQMLQILKSTPQYKKSVDNLYKQGAHKGIFSGMKMLANLDSDLIEKAQDLMAIHTAKLPKIAKAELLDDGTVKLSGKNAEALHLDKFNLNINFNVAGKNFGEKAGQAALSRMINPVNRIGAELNSKLQPNLVAHLKKYNFTQPVAQKLAKGIADKMPTKKLAERIMAQSFKMNIVGTASPDGGTYKGNLAVAKRRAEEAKAAIVRKFKLKPSVAKNITLDWKVVDHKGNKVENDGQAQQIYKKLAEEWNKSLKAQPSFEQKDIQTEKSMKALVSRYNRSTRGFNRTFISFLDDNLKNKRGFEYSMNVKSSGRLVSKSKLDKDIS